MKKNNLIGQIWQSRKLPRLSFRLSLTELKILQCCFGQLKQSDVELVSKELSVSEIVQTCGYKGTKKYCYEQIKRATENLKECIVEYKPGEYYDLGGNAKNTIKWFEHIEYEHGFVKYKLNSIIKDELVGLFQHNITYLKYSRELLPYFETTYGLRIYLILKGDISSHRNFMFYSLDDIVSMLCLSDAYNQQKSNVASANQRNKIIKPAVEEINRFSDISVMYIPEKLGHKIIGWNFIIAEKNQLSELLKTMSIDSIETYCREISKEIQKSKRWEEIISIAKEVNNKIISAWVLQKGGALRPELLKDYDWRCYLFDNSGYNLKMGIYNVLFFDVKVLNNTPPEAGVRNPIYTKQKMMRIAFIRKQQESKLTEVKSKENKERKSPFDEEVPF